MTIGKDQNKDQYQNWQVFGAWKLPFCDHRVIKLTQNCACFTNPCINVHVQSLVNATPRYLNLLPMESIHERNLLLETCEHSTQTSGFNYGVEEFSPISHLHIVRTTTLNRRDANNIQGYHLASWPVRILSLWVKWCSNFQSLAYDKPLRVAFKSPWVKELWSGPIHLPRCVAGAKWCLQSVV